MHVVAEEARLLDTLLAFEADDRSNRTRGGRLLCKGKSCGCSASA